MGIKVRHSVSASLLALCATAVHAAPVDNPGFFLWSTGGGVVTFNAAAPINRNIPINSGVWDTDIDGAGVVTTNAMTIGAVTIGAHTVQLLVQAPSLTATLDAALTANNVALGWVLRVRITGGGVGSSCVTPWFTVPGWGHYQNFMGNGIAYLYTSNWATVPVLTTCMGQEATLNTLLGFGGAAQGVSFIRLGATTPGGPVGS